MRGDDAKILVHVAERRAAAALQLGAERAEPLGRGGIPHRPSAHRDQQRRDVGGEPFEQRGGRGEVAGSPAGGVGGRGLLCRHRPAAHQGRRLGFDVERDLHLAGGNGAVRSMTRAQRRVTEAAQPGQGGREQTKRVGVGPRRARRGGGEGRALGVVALEPPGGVMQRRHRHLAQQHQAIAVGEEVGGELGVRGGRIEIAGVERPGAGVEQRRVRMHGQGLGNHRDMAQARCRPVAHPARQITAAPPIQREGRVEERDALRTPAVRDDGGGERVAQSVGAEVLDRDEHQAGIAEVVL